MFRDLIHATDAEQFVLRLVCILSEEGVHRHEEAVDHLEHALQSADEIERVSGGDAVVVAALLHDLGHLVTGEEYGAEEFLARDLQHEVLGARLLAPWFPESVTEPIRLHVDAKRYLCAVDPVHREALSEVSLRSLELQGGVMDAAEARRFAAGPHAEAAVMLRRADDLAKMPGRVTRPIEEHVPRLLAMARDRRVG